jgi:hypothetical protein
MAFAMANNSNPSARAAAAACRASATESEGAHDGAAVGLMTGVAVSPAHLMNGVAFLGQSKCHCINIGNELEELVHLCNVSRRHFAMVG